MVTSKLLHYEHGSNTEQI